MYPKSNLGSHIQTVYILGKNQYRLLLGKGTIGAFTLLTFKVQLKAVLPTSSVDTLALTRRVSESQNWHIAVCFVQRNCMRLREYAMMNAMRFLSISKKMECRTIFQGPLIHDFEFHRNTQYINDKYTTLEKWHNRILLDVVTVVTWSNWERIKTNVRGKDNLTNGM